MNDFSFIQITDHHLPEDMTALVQGFSPGYTLRAVLRHIAGCTASQADFIISTGDLVDPGTQSSYQNFRRVFKLQPAADPPGPGKISIEGLLDYPFYVIPGNHDERSQFLQHLFSTTNRSPLVNAAFHHKGVQFVCLDMGAQPKATLYTETLDFLSESLQAQPPTIVVTHHHITPVGARWLDNCIADDIQGFWETLTAPDVQGKILGVISGHAHISYEVIVKCIPVFGLRSTAFPFARLDEPLLTLQPPHYRLFTVRDGLLTSRIFEVPL
jgi:Icc protein